MGKKIKNSIKNCLWTHRNKRGFSQKRVAYFLGLHGTSILSRWEHGVKLPNLINALTLAIAYQIPVDFLFVDLYKKLRGEIRGREEKLKKDLEGEESANIE